MLVTTTVVACIMIMYFAVHKLNGCYSDAPARRAMVNVLSICQYYFPWCRPNVDNNFMIKYMQLSGFNTLTVTMTFTFCRDKHCSQACDRCCKACRFHLSKNRHYLQVFTKTNIGVHVLSPIQLQAQLKLPPRPLLQDRKQQQKHLQLVTTDLFVSLFNPYWTELLLEWASRNRSNLWR